MQSILTRKRQFPVTMAERMNRRLLTVSLVVSSFSILGNAADTVLVGRLLGAWAISACGLLAPLIVISMAVSNVLTAGAQIISSRSLGSGDSLRAGNQVGAALIGSIVFSAAVVMLGYLFIDPLCLLLGADPDTELFQNTKLYAVGLLPSLLALTPSALIAYICQANGDMHRCKIVGAMAVFGNAALDVASVMVFDAGILGFGLATTIQSFACLGYLLFHFRRKELNLRLRFNHMKIGDFVQVVLSGLVRAVYRAGMFLLILTVNNILMNHAGQDGVAAYSVVRSVFGIMSSLAAGLFYCTMVTSGISYGQRDTQGLSDTVRVFVKLSILLGLAAIVILTVFAKPLAWLYMGTYTSGYDMAVMGIRIMALTLPLECLCACFQNLFLSTGHKLAGNIIALTTNALFIPLCAFFACPGLGFAGAMLAYPVGYLLMTIMITSACSVKSHASPFAASTYVILPEGYLPKPGKDRRWTILNEEEMNRVCLDLIYFCHEGGTDAGELAAQAVRQAAKDTHAFEGLDAKSMGRDALYVRIFLFEDTWTMQLWAASKASAGLVGSERRSHRRDTPVDSDVREEQELGDQMTLLLQQAKNHSFQSLYGFYCLVIELCEA